MSGTSDYEKRLKRRILTGSMLLLFGGLTLVAAGTLVPRDAVPYMARLVYTALIMGTIGAGAGLVGAGLWLMYHPDQAKSIRVTEEDEREKAIYARAGKWAFWSCYWALLPAMAAAALLNTTVLLTLLGCFGAANVLLLACLVLARRSL